MNELTVTRLNFKDMRLSYGIKIKDISEKCGISEGCINKFENSTGAYTDTNAREYNKQTICRTLQELIEEKMLGLFNVPKKEEKVEIKEKKKLGGSFAETDIPREKLVNYIKEYCMANKMGVQEFCIMCKINAAYTTPSAAKREGSFVTIGVLDKVMQATGWTKEQIMAGFKNDISKPVTVKEETAIKKDERSNVKCTMQDGKYFIEYDILVPQHVCKEISKEEFLKEVSG